MSWWVPPFHPVLDDHFSIESHRILGIHHFKNPPMYDKTWQNWCNQHRVVHACMHAVHTYIRTHVRTYIHKYIHPSIHTYIHPCIHTLHPCMHAYIQTGRQTYIHTYIYTKMWDAIVWGYTGYTGERTWYIYIYIYAWYMIGMLWYGMIWCVFFILIQVCAYIFIYVGYLIGIFFENCNQHQPGHSLNGEMYDSLQCI